MYLKEKASGDLVEVMDLKALFDPCQSSIVGRYHWGEELQDPAPFEKAALTFPSDEGLPRCWLDPAYKGKQ